MSDTNHENPHIGEDVVDFLEDTLPETDETRREGKKEALRLALTDAMRQVRKKEELTQGEVAERLDVSQSWVSKLESANYDHQVESIVEYLDALSADLGLSIRTRDETIRVKYEEYLNDKDIHVPYRRDHLRSLLSSERTEYQWAADDYTDSFAQIA
jgi:transcriptional regulator with XRE-family HTH domain